MPDPDGDWAPEVEEIRRRRDHARAMGGPEKVARQRASGRLTVRERIDRFADPGSFAEIGALAGFADYDESGALRSVTPANFVAGTARVDGRPVLLGADDFTIRGGSGDAAIHAKQIFAEEYAREMRLPVVRLLDGRARPQRHDRTVRRHRGRGVRNHPPLPVPPAGHASGRRAV